jgi:hypothetical protein
MRKYRFRKMYFICENNRIIADNVWSVDAHQHRDKAEIILAQKDVSIKMWEANKPPKRYKVEGFYLVHESLFDLILKEHCKDIKV